MTGIDIRRIVFVVGRPRSGTNLIRSILNLHSDIWISAEPNFIGNHRRRGINKIVADLYPLDNEEKITILFERLKTIPGPGTFWSNPKLDLDKIKSEFARSARSFQELIRITLQVRARTEGKSIFGEKTPGNLYRLHTLLEWFPDAKFLHIVRDPRAVFVSEINRIPHRHYLLRRSNSFTRFLIFVYILCDWNRNIRLHNKYRDSYPGNYMFIRFRKLYLEREDEVKRICRFIGVGFEDAMLHPPRRGSNLPGDYDPIDGWRGKIPKIYKFLFKIFLDRKLKLYT
jgi:hypothetical protein